MSRWRPSPWADAVGLLLLTCSTSVASNACADAQLAGSEAVVAGKMRQLSGRSDRQYLAEDAFARPSAAMW